MMLSTKSAFPLLLAATCVVANCPPPSERRLPVPLITAVEFSTLQHNLTVELDSYLTSASSSDPSFANPSLSATITYSHEDSVMEYNRGPRGSNVTAEHVFRIGSVSKVFAVYEALLHGLDFDSRVADWIPEFGGAGLEEVTVGSLAGQISGLTRDYPINDIAVVGSEYDVVKQIRQTVPVPESEIPSCTLPSVAQAGGGRPCQAEDFIQMLSTRRLAYPPNSFPSYSNIAYDLLGYLVTLETKQNFSALIARDISDGLQMPHTSAVKPSDVLGVIPNAEANSSWYEDYGWSLPSGALYSSSADLAKFARYVLSDLDPNSNGSKLGLSPSVVRKWLHPVSYTSSSTAFIGIPWEDYRPSIRGLNGGFPFTVHAKSGGIPAYSGEIAIVPEYGFGLAVLASGGPGTVATDVRNLLIERVATFTEMKRIQHAQTRYAGRFSTNSTNQTGLLELKVADNGLGLEVVRWTVADLDVAGAITAIKQRDTSSEERSNTSSIRFYPAATSKADIWRYIFNASLPQSTSSISGVQCDEWTDSDQYYYANQPVDLIRFFPSDQDASIAGVEIQWLRLNLTKERT